MFLWPISFFKEIYVGLCLHNQTWHSKNKLLRTAKLKLTQKIYHENFTDVGCIVKILTCIIKSDIIYIWMRSALARHYYYK